MKYETQSSAGGNDALLMKKLSLEFWACITVVFTLSMILPYALPKALSMWLIQSFFHLIEADAVFDGVL